MRRKGGPRRVGATARGGARSRASVTYGDERRQSRFEHLAERGRQEREVGPAGRERCRQERELLGRCANEPSTASHAREAARQGGATPSRADLRAAVLIYATPHVAVFSRKGLCYVGCAHRLCGLRHLVDDGECRNVKVRDAHVRKVCVNLQQPSSNLKM